VVLANPPFKGAVDASDVNPTLPTKVKKTEILFLHLFFRLLDNGVCAAVTKSSTGAAAICGRGGVKSGQW
jgi:hypothetical protein